jgi:hypothetical protein
MTSYIQSKGAHMVVGYAYIGRASHDTAIDLDPISIRINLMPHSGNCVFPFNEPFTQFGDVSLTHSKLKLKGKGHPNGGALDAPNVKSFFRGTRTSSSDS